MVGVLVCPVKRRCALLRLPVDETGRCYLAVTLIGNEVVPLHRVRGVKVVKRWGALQQSVQGHRSGFLLRERVPLDSLEGIASVDGEFSLRRGRAVKVI